MTRSQQIAHDLLKAHTGQEGGCPSIDWYQLRSEIADALDKSLERPHQGTTMTNREDESKMELLNRILREEMNVRVRLNALQADRDILSEKCVTTLIELNALKREAYAMGFTGNIMRGADGERVNTLQEKEAGK